MRAEFWQMLNMKTLENLFLDSLANLYYAESQLIRAFSHVVRATTNEDLHVTIEMHLTQMDGHLKMIEEVFRDFRKPVKSKKCSAIAGIIRKMREIEMGNKKSPTINAALFLPPSWRSIMKLPPLGN
jgi:ferritin-like metal-binding protein YciE